MVKYTKHAVFHPIFLKTSFSDDYLAPHEPKVFSALSFLLYTNKTEYEQ
jgi:hypothetical protein